MWGGGGGGVAERERCKAYGCTVWRCLVNTWGNHSVDNVCVGGGGGGGEMCSIRMYCLEVSCI